MLGSAADLVRPADTSSAGHVGIVAWAAQVLARVAQWLLSRLLFGAHLLLVWIGQRDTQRAEYLAARAAGAARIPLLRQLSIRDEVSLFASHRPRGLRSRMVEAREWRNAAVTLTESRAAQIDAELASDYGRAGRDIAWSS